MGIQVASIASGSNGNCYYAGLDSGGILIDLGISCREFERRMQVLSLSPRDIRGIFISHEHSDHISGLQLVQQRYRIPVYITAVTLAKSRLQLDPSLTRHFLPGDQIQAGPLLVESFSKRHDAAEPCSFTVQYGPVRAGIFTDIGHCCAGVEEQFSKCQMAFLESNYDEDMLARSRYPAHLKRRISGTYGHLSNNQALELFVRHRHPQMSHVFLSHLSELNNCPDLALRTFAPFAGKVKVQVASRYGPSVLSRSEETNRPLFIPEPRQMQLF